MKDNRKFEAKVIENDPFDIMCGECQVHEIEYFREASLDELKAMHSEELFVDSYMTQADLDQHEDMNGEPYEFASADFETWLNRQIELGFVRVVA